MVVSACPCCGIEKPPDSRSAWCGYCGYKPAPPPPPPPPRPARAWLPPAKLELGRVAIETEKRTLKLTPALRLKVGKVETVPAPPPRVALRELLAPPLTRRAISTLNLSAESRFLDQRNEAAHREFLRVLDRITEDLPEREPAPLLYRNGEPPGARTRRCAAVSGRLSSSASK